MIHSGDLIANPKVASFGSVMYVTCLIDEIHYPRPACAVSLQRQVEHEQTGFFAKKTQPRR